MSCLSFYNVQFITLRYCVNIKIYLGNRNYKQIGGIALLFFPPFNLTGHPR